MCDCVAGSIYAFMRDHCDENSIISQLFSKMADIASHTLELKHDSILYDYDFSNEPILKLVSENHTDFWISIDACETKIMFRFLFNLNPFSYQRCTILPTLVNSMNDIFLQLNLFEQDFKSLTEQNRKRTRPVK